MEIIDEKTYQQIKKEMCKTDDYFTEEEVQIFQEKVGLILG